MIAHLIAAVVAVATAAPSQTANPYADTYPRVYAVSGTSRTEIPPSQARSTIPDMPHGGGLFAGIPKSIAFHDVYLLKGLHAATAATGSALFEIEIRSAPFNDSAHAQPVLIRLSAKDDQRTIGAQANSINPMTQKNTLQPIAEDRIPVKVETLAPARFRLTPLAALVPGDYAVAMRDPTVQTMTYSSSGVPDSGERQSYQQMFQLIAWDFSVAATDVSGRRDAAE